MAKKPVISNVASGFASGTTLNGNFEALRDGFDNTISRDGSTPNTMLADFDLNSNDILNAGTINADRFYLDGKGVTSVVYPALLNTPEDFGASTDAADNTEALNAWLAAGAAGLTLGGKGTFNFTGELDTGVCQDFTLIGHGLVLNYTGADTTGTKVQLGGPTGESRRWYVSGVRFASDTVMTSGEFVVAERLMRCTWERVIVDGIDGNGNLFKGLWVKNCGWFTYNYYNINASNTCIVLTGTAATGGRAEYRFINGRALNATLGLHAAGGTGGVYVTGDFSGCGEHIRIDRSIVDEQQREYFFNSHTVFDQTSENGVGINILDTTSTDNFYVNCDGTWISSSDNAGVNIAAGSNVTFQMTGGKIFNHGQIGLGGTGHGIINASTESTILLNGVLFEDNTGIALNFIAKPRSYVATDIVFRNNAFRFDTYGAPQTWRDIDEGDNGTTGVIPTIAQSELTTMLDTNGDILIPNPVRIAANTTANGNLIRYAPGAYTTVDSGFTFTILCTVESPRQHIFRGDGTHRFGDPASNTDTASRNFHVSWFGAFPGSAPLYTANQNDQQPYIQDACDAMGTTREGVLLFDPAPYFVGDTITVNRGTHIKGTGIRKCLFFPTAGADAVDDSWYIFETNGEAVFFTDIQMEHPNQATTERTGGFIKIGHVGCEVRRVVGGRCFWTVSVDANDTVIEDVEGFYNVNGSAGSALVACKGSVNKIRNCRISKSGSFSPDYVVHLGANTGSNTSATTITGVENVHTNSTCGLVKLDGTTSNVLEISITGCQYMGSSSIRGIELVAPTGGVTVGNVNITDCLFSDNPSAAIFCQTNGGTIRDISIDGCHFQAASNHALQLNNVSGSLRDITYGVDNYDDKKTTPYNFAGTISNIKTKGIFNRNGARLRGSDTIADDEFLAITPPGVGAMIEVKALGSGGFPNLNTWGLVGVDTGGSLQGAKFWGGTTMSAQSTAHVNDAITGTDGHLNVGVDTDEVHIKNRLGGSRVVEWEFKSATDET